MAIALGSLLAGAIYTWFVGEDVNWDWLNYHEYNVWAIINGRYGIDALPPGFQTYFNPTVYFPVYYLRHLLPLFFQVLQKSLPYLLLLEKPLRFLALAGSVTAGRPHG